MTDALAVTIHIDGGSRGNPGPAGAGVVIRDAEDCQVIYQGGFFLGKMTNNQAEYNGLLAGLKTAASLGARHVQVYSDSELLVRQMTGVYRVKNANIAPLFQQAKILTSKLDSCQFEHIRRELNAEADELANKAMNLKSNVESAAGTD